MNTITIRSELPIIGETSIEVDQRPKDPLTYQVGASVTFDSNWNLLVEAGTNFDDASIFVANLTYRF